MFTNFPSESTIGNAETLLSTNFFNAKIMLVSSVAVSIFSKVPILNSLSVLLVKDGFGNSWICQLPIDELKQIHASRVSFREREYAYSHIGKET